MCIVLARLIFSVTMPARNELAGFLPGPLICGREILKRRGKAFSFDISVVQQAFGRKQGNQANWLVLICFSLSFRAANMWQLYPIRQHLQCLCCFSLDTI